MIRRDQLHPVGVGECGRHPKCERRGSLESDVVLLHIYKRRAPGGASTELVQSEDRRRSRDVARPAMKLVVIACVEHTAHEWSTHFTEPCAHMTVQPSATLDSLRILMVGQ